MSTKELVDGLSSLDSAFMRAGRWVSATNTGTRMRALTSTSTH